MSKKRRSRKSTLSSHILKRARVSHFFALATIAFVAVAMQIVTWRSFSGYQSSNDTVAHLGQMLFNSKELVLRTQALATSDSKASVREERETISQLMLAIDEQQLTLSQMLRENFGGHDEMLELAADSEQARKGLWALIGQVQSTAQTDGSGDRLTRLAHQVLLQQRGYEAKGTALMVALKAHLDRQMSLIYSFGVLSVLLLVAGLAIEGRFLFRPLLNRLFVSIKVERDIDDIERQNMHLARLQRATEDAYNELEDHRLALVEQAEELKIALARAEEASKLKSQFLANMSHEIRTPLNGVVGMSEILARTELDEEQRQCITTISTSAESLLKIISDILDLSKVEAGMLTVESVPFNLRDLLDSVIDLHLKSAQEKSLSLTCTVPSETELALNGDPVRIGQIATNLLSNAIKFTQEGSVTLGASTYSSEGRLMLRIWVRDTGIGVEPERLPLLFEAFIQADGSTTRQYGGTGLGLSIVKHLAELINGSAGGSSSPGNGSEFWAEVEVKSSPEVVTKTPPLSINVDVPKGLNVLVVEDNPVNQLVATRLLKAEHCNVTLAGNGSEAVALLQDQEFDLILMDIHMPVMDGLEATRQIRAMESGTGRHIPIVALTADAMEQDLSKAIEAGMDDSISKPVRFDAVREKLAKWGVTAPV